MDKQTVNQLCKQLKLGYISNNYHKVHFTTPEQYLAELLQIELTGRKQSKIKRLIKKAGFPNIKTLENYSFSNINFPQTISIEELTELTFIEKQQNIIMLGEVGTGKTHLAIALGIKACSLEYKVKFYRVVDLVNLLTENLKKMNLRAFLREVRQNDLLILDELGFTPIHKDGAELLFNVISDYYEKNSIIITSNLEFSNWNTVFLDNRLAAAAIDRLIHHAHILVFKGESYRFKNALSNC
ncbi:ATP-binding protein [Carboxydothermus islandicus]|uniref:ATP-binding protein n=1 Tax=Carboxydothermus islandicus TaxID=661089 RepID=A0A1L8D2N2_9THEO|nr:IS21-like element helper ATPase IstB [Carboxydothermus islandicus]GAV25445.1 ATP-binding protein [Carboxydothermus islandicus]